MGFGELGQYLVAYAAVAPQELEDAMGEAAKEVEELAKGMAPEDTGALTESIHLTDGTRLTAGVISIDVDYGLVAPDGVAVGVYAAKIHDGSGWAKLGPKSEEKAASNGLPVGAGFMTNAVDMILPTLEQRLDEAAERAYRKTFRGKIGAALSSIGSAIGRFFRGG